ncbi:hypothetical protein HDV01_001962 [Terramyces sp. JEL0728]|nr:hypothetical protein HDV01_001962 [Terramyces sp. JEL0728]
MNPLTFKKVCDYLDTKSIINLSKTNKSNYILSLDEYLWKSRSLIDFPFYFDYCPDIDEPTIEHPLPQLSDSIVQHLKDSFGKTECHCNRNSPLIQVNTINLLGTKNIHVGKQRIHKLPGSYREAYKLIYSGNYSTIVNILNTELFTEMSFSVSLITFNKKTNLFNATSNHHLLQQYKYRMVLVRDNIEESVEKWRIRKCPQELLGHPMQVYVEDIPLTSDSRPAFHIGDEVEVQWRRSQFHPWTCLQYPNPTGIEIPNERYKDELEGITIAFPHFSEDSIWHTLLQQQHFALEEMEEMEELDEFDEVDDVDQVDEMDEDE